ncbi:MAG: hypothetical protein Q8L99_06575 [Polycyclovorans sp.]|jgi:phage tail tape-measure protein|nr:hypothetical protein [Gammaproteobacteria bacterium]MDP1542800.1 hypothetical protein [Polycyclovorans sp.]
MTQLITGNFESLHKADRALKILADEGFPTDQTSKLSVGAAQENSPPAVDHDEAPAAKSAVKGSAVGAAAGAAVGGISAAAVGPLALVATAGLGAYVGSLYGTLGQLGNDEMPGTKSEGDQPADTALTPPGMWVAVAAPTPDEQHRATQILRASGATDISQSEGTIIGGHWADFDPEAPMKPV